MLNTLGGVCGYFVYTRFLKMLPSKRSMDERSAERSKRVGFIRRLVALGIDSLCVSIISMGLSRIAGGYALLIYAPVFFAYYLVFAYLLHGRTPGKAVVKIRIEGIGAGSSRVPICVRYIVRNAFVLTFQLSLRLNYYIEPRYRTFVLIVLFLVLALSFIDLLLSFRRDRRLWYEMLSNTHNVSCFRKERDDANHIDH
jgi:hypothetical protein